jgi:hypothetical protein
MCSYQFWKYLESFWCGTDVLTVLPPMELFTKYRDAGFEVLTSVTTKNTVFWVVTPCSSEIAPRFGGTYLFHLQGRKVSQARNQQNLRNISFPSSGSKSKPSKKSAELPKRRALRPNNRRYNDHTLQRAELFQVIRVVTIRITLVWDLPCTENGGSSFLRNVCKPLFYPEDGGSTILRNVIKSLLYQPSRYSDRLRAGRPRGRSSSPGRIKLFLLSTSYRLVLEPTHPPIQWGQGALSSGLKRPGREADHSSPTSAEIKNMWIYNPLSHTS